MLILFLDELKIKKMEWAFHVSQCYSPHR